MKRIFILDGYNVIHRVPELESRLVSGLDRARQALIVRCAEWFRRRGDIQQLRIVFDGDSSVGHDAHEMVHGIRVVYSETGETADERILSMLGDTHPPQAYVVVSDDREVTGRSRRQGASVMSAAAFFRYSTSPTHRAGPGAAGEKPEPGSTTAQNINKQLIAEWDL